MPVKMNKTAYIVLLCMKFMCKHNIFTVQNIVDYLEQYNFFISNETVLKYIRTMKLAGFRFSKPDRKSYQLIYIPFDNNKTTENNILEIFGIVSKYIIGIDNTKKQLINKLSLLLSDDKKLKFNKIMEQNAEYIKKNKQLKKLQKYCNDKTKINITLDNNYTYYFEPQKLITEHGNIYLIGINTTSRIEQKINIHKIISIKQTPQTNSFITQKKYVTLKISYKFKNRYMLKPDEEILEENQNYVVVRSSFQDKITLFKNLLRYTGNCEIMSPTAVRQEFLNYTSQIYQMYDCK